MLIPVVRVMLRSGMSAAEFMTAAKTAYLQAAATEVATKVNRRPNISRISAATGLTRREVGFLLRSTGKEGCTGEMNTGAQPLQRVLVAWQRDREFVSKQKKPKSLPLAGGKASFEALVKRHGGDIPVVAVLKELERYGCVERVGQSRVSLVRETLGMPAYNERAVAKYGHCFTNFAESLESHFSPEKRGGFVDMRESFNVPLELLPLFRKTFAERSEVLLSGFDTWVKRNASTSLALPSGKMGLGVYLMAPQEAEKQRK